MLHDLKFALRLLLKSPAFAGAAILVLTLGIGVNTGMFTVIHALAFSPRPFADPGRIVQVYTQDRKEPSSFRPFSQPIWRELNGRSDLFTGALAYDNTVVGVRQGEETRRTLAAIVSANYFEVLGVPLARGRGFAPAEETPGSTPQVVIVSHAYWRRSGFDPDLLGRTLRINERTYTIIGIAPEGFSGTTMLFGPELFFPLGDHAALQNFVLGEERRSLERADTYTLLVVARLAPGVDPAQARSALDALGANLERAFPVEFKDQTVTVAALPRLGSSSSPRSETPVMIFCGVLMSLAGAVLLIVCLNLASLLLARGQARRKEFAIRLALGGSRARLIRQLCLEGLLLAVVGGTLGVWLSRMVLDVIFASMEARLPITLFVGTGGAGAIIAATAAICIGATLAFSLGPALRLSRGDVLTDLKLQTDSDPGATRPVWWRPRHPLVVMQIALSLTLLIVAGLFLRLAFGTLGVDHGFRADHTVVAEVDSSLGGLDEPRSLEAFREVRARLGALPGVSGAAFAAIVPYGFVSSTPEVRRNGPDLPPDARPSTAAEGLDFSARWNAISADYFAVMGLRLIQGRDFSAAETEAPGAPRVVIIDEILARQLWPEGDALGQSVRFTGRRDGTLGPLQVVGIVASSRVDFFDENPPGAIYVPFAQGFSNNAFFHIRPAQDTAAAAIALTPQVRRLVQETAPGLPLFKVRTFKQHAEDSIELWAMNLGSTLLSVFSLFAMFVAVAGIYSVKAYQVSRRTREIGIRMALGALPSAVQGLILREGVVTALAGIGIGLLFGAGVNRLLSSVMYGLKPFDPAVLAAAAALFLAAATVAAWLPARRATKVNPLEALRTE